MTREDCIPLFSRLLSKLSPDVWSPHGFVHRRSELLRGTFVKSGAPCFGARVAVHSLPEQTPRPAPENRKPI